MLIRLYNHHARYNRSMIDEVININGLPEDLFFEKRSGFFHHEEADEKTGEVKKEWKKLPVIKPPWEPDIVENYPKEVIDKFGIEKEYYVQVDRQLVGPYTVRALRLDYSYTQGEQMWKKIEGILERETPRDRSVPVPSVVGNDSGWTLEVDEIPTIDLGEEKKPEPPVRIQDKIKSALST